MTYKNDALRLWSLRRLATDELSRSRIEVAALTARCAELEQINAHWRRISPRDSGRNRKPMAAEKPS